MSETNQFLLFAGNEFYPEGGALDFKGSFKTLDDALKAHDPKEHEYQGGWANVLDLKQGKVVKEFYRGIWSDGDAESDTTPNPLHVATEVPEWPDKPKGKCHKVVINQAGPYLETVVIPHCDPVAASGRIEDCVCNLREAQAQILAITDIRLQASRFALAHSHDKVVVFVEAFERSHTGRPKTWLVTNFHGSSMSKEDGLFGDMDFQEKLKNRFHSVFDAARAFRHFWARDSSGTDQAAQPAGGESE